MTLHNLNKRFSIVFLLLICQSDVHAQENECQSYEIIKDSIGQPFITEATFLREVGMKQNDGEPGVPYDRLIQYPYFIQYADSSHLFDNYEGGLFAFVNGFSLMKDSFTNRKISFYDGINLNGKFSSLNSSDTLCQSVKFKKRGNYKDVNRLCFLYEVYRMKVRVVYIGKYCRLIPNKFIRKNEPMFFHKPLDVYIILDIIQ